MGIRRRSELRRRIELLRHTLMPSLSAQTSDHFQWQIVTDTAIDRDSEEELRALLAGYDNFGLTKVDTFANASMGVPAAQICEDLFGSSENILLSRIDDDDAVATDFVEALHASLAGKSGLISVSFENGALLDPRRDVVVRFDARGHGVGLSILSPDVSQVGPYTLRHKSAAEDVIERGGSVIDIATDHPCWVQVLYHFSDSRETRGGGDMIEKLMSSRPAIGTEDSKMLLARLGLAPDFSQRLLQVLDDCPIERIDISESDLPRLSIKKEILNAVRDTRAKAAKAKDKNRYNKRLAALRAAYFAF